ncbi:hypothetical protein [Kribbella swartbergensis]
MTEVITGELRALAGPELYRRNAFRISGLTATVDRRTTRQVLQRLRAALQVGADVDLGPNASSDPAEVQAACDLILGDPRRRLVHEVFAPWGDDVSKCGCPPEIHRRHDAAVQAHATAIEAELRDDDGRKAALTVRDKHWSSAGRDWGKLLDAHEFWDHLDHRVRELDDRQLDRSALDLIDDELQRTLLKPLTDLAATTKTKPSRLLHDARRWPAPAGLVDQLIEAAVSPLYEDLEQRRSALNRRSRQESPNAIAAEIERNVVPALRKLDTLVPPDRHHRTAILHDQFAILLNNCAVQLLDRDEVADGRAARWLDTAASLVIDPRDQDLIEANQETLRASRTAMQDFEEQVGLLLDVHGRSAAIALLREARNETDSPTLRAEIDRILREIADGSFETRRLLKSFNSRGGSPTRSPSYPTYPSYLPTYYRPPRRWPRVLFWLLVIAAIGYGLSRCDAFDSTTVSVFSARIADNPKPGTCLGQQKDDWRSRPTALRLGDCDEPHWGEVLAYAPLTKVPAEYPGDVQASALGTFRCGEELVQQGLSPDEYDTAAIFARAEYWNTGKDAGNKYENYAACIVRRRDGAEIPAGQKVKEDAPSDPKAVAMDLYGGNVAVSAPVGTCIQAKGSIGTAAIGKVPVVRCEVKHWAQVFGYPTIFEPGEKWPGDDAVLAKAKKACSKVVPNLPGYTTAVGWPDRSWWTDPSREIYTYCLVHRVDGKPFEGRLG